MLASVRPGIGLWHDETAADSFVVAGQGPLSVGESSPGTLGLHVGTHWSTRLAAYATVAVPDTFLSITGVWLRVAGTMAARGDYSLPYFAPGAEVVSATPAQATFRGFVYRVSEDSCDACDDRNGPLAPDNDRFAFTVMGVVDRAPTLVVTRPAPGSAGSPGSLLLVGWNA